MKHSERKIMQHCYILDSYARNVLLAYNWHEKLTVLTILMTFLTMYGNSALFALESFSYFLFNIVSAVNGGFLNNQYAFDDIIGKSGDKFYSWVSNAYKNNSILTV